jgi:hypothetical protein
MDLTSITDISGNGAELVITHPVTGQDTDIKFTLAGSDSEQYRKAQRLIQNRRLQKPGRMKLDAAVIEKEALELLAACVISWKGVQLDGMELPCTRENAMGVFERFPWLRDQCDNFIGDRQNFLQD